MPLPLIPAALALASLAGAGLKKGYDGISDMKAAKRIAERAKSEHEDAVESLNKQRDEVIRVADDYAEYLLHIKDTTFKRTVEILEKINSGQNEKIYEILEDVGISSVEIQEYKQTLIYVQSFIKGGLSSIGTGVAAGQGATALAVLFGSASTGTAISSLSGVAATNAMLAWLGGGTLASGGGGMAMGSIMLGGIAVAPAIAVSGFVLASQGKKALTQACEYDAEVKENIAKIETTKEFLKRVITQIEERASLMHRLNERASNVIDQINPDTFDVKSDSDVKKVQKLLNLIKSMSEIMQAPILNNENGELDENGLEITLKYKKLLNEG